ncbi:glucosaminidase domain-containing protein [Psychromonas algicola]|uniref:glucosaminidase domain-containing protein n=1 Tax=Psychromonas algicola TaxID=2555642 RepID=UPI0010683A49|nr:glucosaminidase domain-containing protein [Psychromonas sp. RZ5]TEW45329.1 glucosaminidase [Psychromonas sp. RZ5]
MTTKLLIPLSFSLFLMACSEEQDTTTVPVNDLMKNPTVIKVKNLEKLKTVLTPYDYTFDDWEEGLQEVPRLTFSGFTKQLNEQIEKIPVENKKSVFFRLMLPLILAANEKILHEREVVKTSALDSPELVAIALKYRVIKETVDTLTQANKDTLLKRVNIIPPSLALAQAAEESGWGSSRFTLEGNAFFGQWDFSGNGIKPKQQRKELGNYGIARFKSPLASVEGYMLNINTTSAYQSLRDLRATQIKQKKPLSGLLLAGTLLKYSERGEAYIKGLRHLIRYNKLSAMDEAYLSGNQLIYLEF